MSSRPDSLVECVHYLRDKMGIAASNFSVRAARSARGFHAGKGEIFGPNGKGKKDYSVKDQRNFDGLSNASSALDIRWPGHNKDLRLLVAHLVANHGNLLFEVIGPDAQGKANYWSAKTNWQPRPDLATPDHSWHAHLGFWRDTEFDDRAALFRSYFEPQDTPPPVLVPDPTPDPAPDPDTEIEALVAENAELKAKIAAAQVALS